MRQTDGYKQQIDTINERLDNLEKQRERLVQNSGPSEMVCERSYTDWDNIHMTGGRMSAETLVLRYLATNREIEKLVNEKNQLERNISKVLNVVPNLKHTRTKVWYLRDFCGMGLPEIAEELGLTYDYVREISANLEKE